MVFGNFPLKLDKFKAEYDRVASVQNISPKSFTIKTLMPLDPFLFSEKFYREELTSDTKCFKYVKKRNEVAEKAYSIIKDRDIYSLSVAREKFGYEKNPEFDEDFKSLQRMAVFKSTYETHELPRVDGELIAKRLMFYAID